jgi:small-conductance mechanosensitive channel
VFIRTPIFIALKHLPAESRNCGGRKTTILSARASKQESISFRHASLGVEIFRVLQPTLSLNRSKAFVRRRTAHIVAVAAVITAGAFSQTQSATPESSATDIIRFLNQTIVWHRQTAAQQHLVSEPNDVLFFNDDRRMADQIVQDSFDFARMRAQALPAETSTAATPTTQRQRIAQRAAQAEERVKEKQKEQDGLRQQMAKASGKKRLALQAAIAEGESEIALYQAQLVALHNVLQAIGRNEGGSAAAGNLTEQIEELARTVPFVEKTKETKAPNTAATARAEPTSSPTLPAVEHQTAPSGLFALITDMFAQRRKMQALNDQSRAADSLAQESKDVRSPLVSQVRALIQKGDQMASQPNPTDPATLAQQKNDLDEMTTQYKELSSALLPLGKQSMLLEQYKRSVSGWRDVVQDRFRSDIKNLALRLTGLGLVLGIVLGVAEVWRRATFRYVTDAHRRYQFLLLRRILLWALVATIVAFAFSSELGALTTFAGLLTAGVAFALQSVLLSVVGYFMLIGKYGMRAGDRVQIAGVTGDVVDIGLVRLHLMEVTGGTSPQPTGRIVAFPNSVVFQATSGLFKPIPGTNFLWHEITVTLAPETNYRQVEQRMLDAVNKVYAEYREKLEMQRHRMELSLRSIRIGSFAPESRLRLAPTGLEVAIRYPVELNNAAEIDDHVTREILEAVSHEPKLQVLGAQIEPKTA